MNKSSLFDILFSRDDQGEKDDAIRRRKFFSREFSGSMTKKFKKLMSKPLFKFAKSFAYLLSHVSAKVYGTALLAFGLVSTLMYFLKLSYHNSIVTPIIGASICVVALPFLFAEKPLPIILQRFALTDYLFFEFFCMKRHSDLDAERKFPLAVAFIIGLIPAVLSAFVSLWLVTLIIGIAIAVYIGMESPEFIFLLSLFALPYLRYIRNAETALIIAVALAALSFIVKVIYGKRVLYIEQYDIFIGLMMTFVLISGIFLKGVESFSDSVSMIVLVFGYMLAGNIITNRRLAERLINTVVISGSFAAGVSLIQLAIVLLGEAPLTVDSFSILLARQDGMVVFFIASALFSIGMIKQYQKNKALYMIPTLLSFAGLIISGEFFALIVLFIGAIAYLILKANRLTLLILPVFLFAPLAILLLPNELLNMFFYYSPSIASAENLFTLWNNSFTVFINNFFLGVGMGSESFAQEMAALGMVGYPDSSNILIEIGLEAGVFALLAFLCVLITRLRHRSIQHLYVRNSQIRTLVGISETAIFCMLGFGMINYIWSNLEAYYLFWCIFGIGSGLLRFAKKDYDDKVLYYEEASAHDSSVIDIEIG